MSDLDHCVDCEKPLAGNETYVCDQCVDKFADSIMGEREVEDGEETKATL